MKIANLQPFSVKMDEFARARGIQGAAGTLTAGSVPLKTSARQRMILGFMFLTIVKPREHSRLGVKQICEHQAYKRQPNQPPLLEYKICQKNKTRDNSADHKGIISEQNDILTKRRRTKKQVTGADLAAQNIRDEWHNQTRPR